MSTSADLVMPKLGLTMTEGRVAEWIVRPGARFAQGDILVVIETDKIANDVGAPAPGRLVEILVDAGAVVPVGQPIARWELEGAQETQAAFFQGPAEVSGPVVFNPAHNPQLPARPALGAGDRVIATPLARRLAREAGFDLFGLEGSGPNGRIKAADVEKALHSRLESPPAELKAAGEPAKDHARSGARQQAAVRLSFAAVDVEADALQAIQARLARSGNGNFGFHHYVALACVRALEPQSQDAVRLSFGLDAHGAPSDVIEAGRRDSLSALAAKIAVAEASDAGAGDVLILLAEGGLHIFGPAVPVGWRMALGVGSVRRTRRLEESAHELSLTLSYDATTIEHGVAARFLGRVKALLEEPLQLLAS